MLLKKQHKKDITVSTGVGLDACGIIPSLPLHLVVTVVAKPSPSSLRARRPELPGRVYAEKEYSDWKVPQAPPVSKHCLLFGPFGQQILSLSTSFYSLVDSKAETARRISQV